MKFVPRKYKYKTTTLPFCNGPHEISRSADFCGECDNPYTIKHMTIEDGSRVPLCQRCYEMYAEFIALERLVGV